MLASFPASMVNQNRSDLGILNRFNLTPSRSSEASANTSPPSQKHEILLGEEEISDISLATFHVFDKENAGPPPLFQKLRLAAGGGACGACSCAPCAYWPQPPQPPKATQPTQHRKKKPPSSFNRKLTYEPWG